MPKRQFQFVADRLEGLVDRPRSHGQLMRDAGYAAAVNVNKIV
ncbi:MULTISPECIES: hypothetical protein [Streptomyces]